MQIAYTTLRRIRGDMIETYKIVSGKYDNLAAPMLHSTHSYATRGHDLRLQKNRARYDLRKFFPLTEWSIFGILYRIMLCMLIL